MIKNLNCSPLRFFSLLILVLYSYISNAQYHAYPYFLPDKITLDPEILAREMIYESYRQNPNLELFINFDKYKYWELFDYLGGHSRLSRRYHDDFHSQDLVVWILSQPDNSIAPHNLFSVAVELTNGDVLEAIVRIHETLRNYARGLAPYTYKSIGLESRNNLFNKFIDIRGDLNERNPRRLKGDHYGSWYRLWILMAYQIATNQTQNGYQVLRLQKLKLVSYLAEVIKLILPGFYYSDKRKAEINSIGARTGFYLNRIIRNGFIEEYIDVQGSPLFYMKTKNTTQCILSLRNQE